MALQQPLSAATDQGVIIVFATACAAVLLFVLVGLLVREFDISQLYYPIIILTCLGNLVVPLFGGLGVIQGELVSIAYNLFILMVWCLLANVANRTDLSYVRVFGWGRGASAAGTPWAGSPGRRWRPCWWRTPATWWRLPWAWCSCCWWCRWSSSTSAPSAWRSGRLATPDRPGNGRFLP